MTLNQTPPMKIFCVRHWCGASRSPAVSSDKIPQAAVRPAVSLPSVISPECRLYLYPLVLQGSSSSPVLVGSWWQHFLSCRPYCW